MTLTARGLIHPAPRARHEPETVVFQEQAYTVGEDVPCDHIHARLLQLTGWLIIARQIRPDGSFSEMKPPQPAGGYPAAPAAPGMFDSPEAHRSMPQA